MSTQTEDNMLAARECFARASRGDFDSLDQVVAADYVLHNPDEVRGIDGLRAMVEGYRSALPDLRVSIDHQFADGDYVATRFTIRGTHDGELMGTPPTGRAVAFPGITVSRCRDGKLVEEWEMCDVLGLLQQVGALPAAEPAVG